MMNNSSGPIQINNQPIIIKIHKIPTKVLENWISKILEEFDADELFKMLANECDKKQTAYLHDAIKDELRLNDTYVIQCTNLNDKLKF